jgi:hypothetical protein
MGDLSWNGFRKEHKGQSIDKIKKLWKKYKEGTYVIGETNSTDIEIIETIQEESEPLPVVEEVDHRKEFLRLFNEVFVIPDEKQEQGPLYRQLMIHAKETLTQGYVCGVSDGWTLYLDQTDKALLVNETRHVAFAITRAYYHRFYQGAALIDEQIFGDKNGVDRLKIQFSRQEALISRYPIPNHDIKVPHSALEVPLPSGVD